MTRFLAASIAAAVGALTLAAGSPAQAKFLPNLAAKTYCDLRALGVSKAEAITASGTDAHIVAADPMVTVDGQQYPLSVIQTTVAIANRCPEFL